MVPTHIFVIRSVGLDKKIIDIMTFVAVLGCQGNKNIFVVAAGTDLGFYISNLKSFRLLAHSLH